MAPEVTLITRASAGEWRLTFLTVMRETANVRLSCQFAGISRKTAYAHRAADEEFREQWDEALQDALDKIELAAYRHAHNGDAGLIKWLLSTHRPEVYGEKPVKHDVNVTVRREAERMAEAIGVPVDDLISMAEAIASGRV